MEIALGVDEDSALDGLFRERIVADGVVGEVVEHFEGEEVARVRHQSVPVEDGFVDDLNVRGVPARRGRAVQLGGLEVGERG